MKKISPKNTSIAITPITPEIVELPEVKERITKFRVSGHSIDQKLKYNSGQQANLFDSLSPRVRDEIRKRIKDEVLVEGIRISPAEDKLLNAILKIFWDKSTQDEKGNLIKAGNMPFVTNAYGGTEAQFPQIAFKAAELYKEYTCSNDYAGSEIEHIKETIQELARKRFLIIYKRKITTTDTNGKIIEEREQRIEDFINLFKVVTFLDLTKKEAEEIDKGNLKLKAEKSEIVILLNPIFIDQIDTKFIEYPIDINKRTAIAAGGHSRVTQSINNLRDYLIRAISANKKKKIAITEINMDKLPFLLGLDKYFKQRKRKRIEEIINRAVETVVNMRLVNKAERIEGVNGQYKFVFELNLDF
jgi:hypothetical protein